MKRQIKTSKSQIFNYWYNSDNRPNDDNLNIIWEKGLTHCWNCGSDKKNGKTNRLQRCHIIPFCLGGKDTPSNYVLLCNECHKEAPNTLNKLNMWHWIKSNKVSFSGIFPYNFNKALDKFHKNYGFTFFEVATDYSKLKKLNLNNGTDVLNQLFFNHIGTHSYIFNESTYYYQMVNIYNELKGSE